MERKEKKGASRRMRDASNAGGTPALHNAGRRPAVQNAVQSAPYNNDQIASLLFEMGALCAMLNMEYKQRAYEMAAGDVKIYPRQVAEIYQQEGIKGLTQIPNVGTRIARHIEELLTTGRWREYEEYKTNIPVDLPELLVLDGVGPKTIRELYYRLGVRNVRELEQACREGRVRDVPRFGIKSEQRILSAIEAGKRND